jgi:hypothetical protein
LQKRPTLLESVSPTEQLVKLRTSDEPSYDGDYEIAGDNP